MSNLMDYAEECLSKPCELHSEHEKALYALRDCVTEMSRLREALKDSRAEIQRLSAVDEPVEIQFKCERYYGDENCEWLTEMELDHPNGDFFKCKPEESRNLYTAPPSVAALIAEEREACAKIVDRFIGIEVISSAIRARGTK